MKSLKKCMAVLTTAALMLSMLTTANAADSVSVKAGDTALSTQTSSEIDINDNLVVTFPDGTNAAEKSVEINEVVYEDVMKLSSIKNANGSIADCPMISILLPGSTGSVVNTPLTGVYTLETEFNMSPIDPPKNTGWETLTGFRVMLEGQDNNNSYSELRIRPDFGMALSNRGYNADRGENYIIKSNTWNKLKLVWDLTNSTGRTLNVWLNDQAIYENIAISDGINAYNRLRIGGFNMESLEKSMLINNLSFTKTENGTTTAILDTDFSDVTVDSLLSSNCQKAGDGIMSIDKNVLYSKTAVDCTVTDDENVKTLDPTARLDVTKKYVITVDGEDYPFTAANLKSNLVLDSVTTADGTELKNGGYITTQNSKLNLNFSLPIDETSSSAIEFSKEEYSDALKLTSVKKADGGIVGCPVFNVLLPGSNGNMMPEALTGVYTLETEFKMSEIVPTANSNQMMDSGFYIRLEGNSNNHYSDLRIRPDYGTAISNNGYSVMNGDNYIVKSNTWNKIKMVWDLTNTTGRTVNVWLNDVKICNNTPINDSIIGYNRLRIGSADWSATLEKSMLINNLSFTKTENGTTTAILDTDFSNVTVNSLLNGNCQKNGDGSMTIENILYASEKAPYTAEFSEDKKTVTITPDRALGYLDTYKFTIGEGLLSVDQARLINPETFELTSVYDSNVYAKYTKVTENAGAYTGEARLINYTNESAAVDLITVVFDGSKMVDFNKKTVTVPANGDITDTVTVTPETDGEYTAECYVWNSIDNLMPVCPNF